MIITHHHYKSTTDREKKTDRQTDRKTDRQTALARTVDLNNRPHPGSKYAAWAPALLRHVYYYIH